MGRTIIVEVYRITPGCAPGGDKLEDPILYQPGKFESEMTSLSGGAAPKVICFLDEDATKAAAMVMEGASMDRRSTFVLEGLTLDHCRTCQ